MKNSHLKNSLIAAGIAVFAGVVTLGANVAISATTPTQTPAASSGVSPTFTGLNVTPNGIDVPTGAVKALQVITTDGVIGGFFKTTGAITAASLILTNDLGMESISPSGKVRVQSPMDIMYGISNETPGGVPVKIVDADGVDIQGPIQNTSNNNAGRVVLQDNLFVAGPNLSSNKGFTLDGVNGSIVASTGALLLDAAVTAKTLDVSSILNINYTNGKQLALRAQNIVDNKGVSRNTNTIYGVDVIQNSAAGNSLITNDDKKIWLNATNGVEVIGNATFGSAMVNPGTGKNGVMNIFGPSGNGQSSTLNLMDTNNYIQAIWGGNLTLRSYNGISLQVNHSTAGVNIDNTGKITSTGGFGTIRKHDSSGKIINGGATGSHKVICDTANYPKEKLISCGANQTGWGYLNSIVPDYATGTCTAFVKNTDAGGSTLTVYAMCLDSAN